MPIIKKKRSKDFPPFHGNSSGAGVSNAPPSNNNNNNNSVLNISSQNPSGNTGGGGGSSSGLSTGGNQNGGQGGGSGSAGSGLGRGGGLGGSGNGINPCPLCGSTNITILSQAQAITNVYTGKILCQNCGLGIERHRFNQRVTQSELIRDWNSL